jgi:predicted nucleotidyltransferase
VPEPRRSSPPLLLPVGTRIVARGPVRAADGTTVHAAGAVGTVVQSPSDYWHSYRVRFADDVECSLTRRNLAVLSEFQENALGQAPHSLLEHGLFDRVIYRCVIGSRAYGLDDSNSDTDRRGIYLPPADLHWSLYGVPEQLENEPTQEVYWEIQKFFRLGLKANPNVLECLYTPLVEYATPLAEEMLGMRDAFLSKLVYQTFNGYVMSQFKKLQADLRNHGQVKWKHVMHLIRLLLSGIETLRQGQMPVRVGEHRQRLIAIKAGELDLETVEAWRLQLHREMEAAYRSSPLPALPDYERVNALLLKARRGAAT